MLVLLMDRNISETGTGSFHPRVQRNLDVSLKGLLLHAPRSPWGGGEGRLLSTNEIGAWKALD